MLEMEQNFASECPPSYPYLATSIPPRVRQEQTFKVATQDNLCIPTSVLPALTASFSFALPLFYDSRLGPIQFVVERRIFTTQACLKENGRSVNQSSIGCRLHEGWRLVFTRDLFHRAFTSSKYRFVIPRVSSRHISVYRFIHQTVPFGTNRGSVFQNSGLHTTLRTRVRVQHVSRFRMQICPSGEEASQNHT